MKLGILALTCWLAVGQQSVPRPVPSEATVALMAGKPAAIAIGSPQYGNRPKEYPLLHVGTVTLTQAADQPTTLELKGSVTTAAEVDYGISVWLQ